jgi:hypothetical protein
MRKKAKSKLELLLEEQNNKYVEVDDINIGRGNYGDAPHATAGKQKEKSIGEVIEKVALWRKLYAGFTSETG